MKSHESSGKPKSKLLLVRKVTGVSMLPTLPAGRLVIATGLFRQLKAEDVVVIWHDGIEKIKRVGRIREGRIYLVGDNLRNSLDSRSFGWLPLEVVSAKVLWPRL